MEPKITESLEKIIFNINRLYGISSMSETSKEFYLSVYNYMDYVSSVPVIQKILEEDEILRLENDIKLRDNHDRSMWATRKRDDDLQASMYYMDGCDPLYMIVDYWRLEDKIYNPLHWYKTDGIKINSAYVMLHGKKYSDNFIVRKLQSGSFRKDGDDRTYIDGIIALKRTLKRFNANLLTSLYSIEDGKVDNKSDANTKFIQLEENGDFHLLGKIYNFNPGSRGIQIVKHSV